MVQNNSDQLRGRPRSFDEQDVLKKLQDAFWEGGFEGTSLGDLTEATGLNRPSLYGAFGDKHAMYLQVLRAYRDTMHAAAGDLLDAAPTLRTGLERVYKAAIGIYTSGREAARGCFVTSTSLSEAVHDGDIRHELAAMNDALDAVFEARIRRAQDDGEACIGLRPEDAARLASSVLHSLSVRARGGASKRTLQALAESGVNLLAPAVPTD